MEKIHKNEAQLQSSCVEWYRNDWYKNLDGLWATFNEGQNVGGKLSMGMLAGVSDLLLKDARGLIGIEMKFDGNSHDVKHLRRQANWILNVCDGGGFCDSEDRFKRIVMGESAWIDPKMVLEWLKNVKTKTVVWDSKKFDLYLSEQTKEYG